MNIRIRHNPHTKINDYWKDGVYIGGIRFGDYPYYSPAMQEFIKQNYGYMPVNFKHEYLK